MEQILPTDTFREMARKIFYTFDIGYSVAIFGFVDAQDGSLKPKGELVCEELRRLDRVENYVSNVGARGGGMRRRRNLPANHIGDYIKNKTFKWDMKEIDNKIKYTIWRIQ